MPSSTENVAVLGPRRYHLLLDGEGTAEEVAADLAKLRAASAMYEALREGHLETCPSHPMRSLERQVAALEAALVCPNNLEGHRCATCDREVVP